MNRLLYPPVEDRGNTQHARASTGLWYVHPSHGLGLIRAFEDLLFNLRPMLSQMVAQLRGLHPIDSRSPLIALHRLQGRKQIASFEHLLDEVWFSGNGRGFTSRKV